MRFEAVKAIYQAALADPTIHFLTGDLGHAHADDFRTNRPDNYHNTGIAEQNMIGIASGLALSGAKTFVYSIIPFITLRCLEQIKVDVCYQNTDVTIIGVGQGFAYGPYGGTHYSIEDISCLRALPHMKIVCPATPHETKILTQEIISRGGPSYIRLGRGGEKDLTTEYPVAYGKGSVVRAGEDISIIAAGPIITEALGAADALQEQGITAEVISMHTIKPIDGDLLRKRAAVRKGIFTLEEHNTLGGLGSAVAEVIMEASQRPPIFKIFGVPDQWPKTVGSQEYLRDLFGLSAGKLAAAILSLLK